MTTKDTYLITQPLFGVKEKDGKKIIHHCSILNYGKELGNGMIEFVTHEGKKTQTKSEFESSIKLFKFDEISLDNLMSKWSKINNEYKPIVLDETIDTNEVYKNTFSPLSIMIERRKECIAIKPLFV